MADPSQADYFAAAAQSFAPMMSVQQPNYPSPLEGAPFVNSNPLMGLFLQGPIASMMGMSNMAPMGFSDRNVYDIIKNQSFWQQQMAFQQNAAQWDRDNYMRTARGFAAITGTPWGSEQIARAGAFANVMTSASPILSLMMPDIMDQLGGLRGSAAVMAGQIGFANQYRIDPLTGRVGIRPDEQNKFFEQLYGGLYGPNADITQTRGITAGQMGSLYGELTRRGMIEGFAGPRDAIGQAFRSDNDMQVLRQVAQDRGFQLPESGGRLDMGKLSQDQLTSLTDDSRVGDRIRTFDADRVNRKLKDYLGAVNAMRDIFGEMGKPNAPLPELLNALEMLTNGSMSQMAPGDVSRMVRMTQQLAGNAGLTMQQAMMLQGDASSKAAQLGIDPVFAVQAAQGSMAFATAYRGAGGNATPAWGKFNMDQMMQLDENLRLGAANSPAFYRASLASLLNEQAGGFAKDSRAAAYVSALENFRNTGIDTFVDPATGKARSLMLNQRDFIDIFNGATTASGNRFDFNVTDYAQMMANQSTLREYGARNEYGNLVRRNQLQLDLLPRISNMIPGTVMNRLERLTGMDRSSLSRALQAARGGIASDIFDPASDLNNMTSDQFNQQLGTILQRHLAEQGVTISDDARGMLGVEMHSSIDTMISRDPTMRQYRNLRNAVAANLPTHTGMADSVLQRNRIEAQLRDALAPINRSEPLRRTMAYLQRVGPGDDPNVLGVISSMMGGVDKKDIQGPLLDGMRSIAAQRQKIDQLTDAIAQASDPATKQRLIEERANAINVLSNTSKDLQIAMNRIQPLSPVASEHDANVALEAMNRGTVTVQDLQDKMAGKSPEEQSRMFMRFWSGEQGKAFAGTLRERYSSAEDLATRLVTDRVNRDQYGLTGVTAAKTITDQTQVLRELATMYAGGDVARLVSGDLDVSLSAEKRAEVMGQVTGANSSIKAQLTAIKQLSVEGRKAWDRDAMIAKNFDANAVDLEMKLNPLTDSKIDQYAELMGKKQLTSAEAQKKAELEKELGAVASGNRKSLTELVQLRSSFKSSMDKAGDEALKSMGTNVNDVARSLETFDIFVDPNDLQVQSSLQGERGRMLSRLAGTHRELADMARKRYGDMKMDDNEAVRRFHEEYVNAKKAGNKEFYSGMDDQTRSNVEWNFRLLDSAGGAAGSLADRGLTEREIRDGSLFTPRREMTETLKAVIADDVKISGTLLLKKDGTAEIEATTQSEGSPGVAYSPSK